MQSDQASSYTEDVEFPGIIRTNAALIVASTGLRVTLSESYKDR